MNFTVFGAKGWIGSKIVKLLEEKGHRVHLPEIRVDDTPKLEEYIRENRPDRIICAIGRTHGEGIITIDYLEKPGKLRENVRDNLYSPVSLALLCQHYNIHLTYLGTGCLFTYNAEKRVFTEEDYPTFFGSSYSTVKGFTDSLMKLLPVLNLRIRFPISKEINKREFITKLEKYEKICSIPNSMTVLDDLLPILIDMSEKEEVGTYNFTNPGVMEHKEILDMIGRTDYELVDYETQRKLLLSERSNNELSADKLLSKYHVDDIRTSVKRVLENRN